MSANQSSAAAERAAIEAAIPHRAPFLLVDRVLAQGADWIETQWLVPADADWTRGHYPGFPLLPGVLGCEHALQSAAILISHLLQGFSKADGIPVLTRIYDARLRSMARPGDLLETRVEVEQRLGPAWYMQAKVRCGGRRVLEARFVLSAAAALARATGGAGAAQ